MQFKILAIVLLSASYLSVQGYQTSANFRQACVAHARAGLLMHYLLATDRDALMCHINREPRAHGAMPTEGQIRAFRASQAVQGYAMAEILVACDIFTVAARLMRLDGSALETRVRSLGSLNVQDAGRHLRQIYGELNQHRSGNGAASTSAVAITTSIS